MQTTRQTWEFVVEEGPNVATLRDAMTRRGSEGWELVSVVGGQAPAETMGPAKTLRNRRDSQFYAFFKRPKDEI